MISTHDRVAIFGRTGSGKTTLARYLLRNVTRYAVIDPKQEFHMQGAVIRTAHDPKPDKIIYRSPIFGRGEMEWYDNLILSIFLEKGKRVTLIDETHFVTKYNPTSPGLARAMRMGRSKGKGVWLLTQSTAYVPHEMRSQTDHIFVFHMQDENDRKRIATMIGKRSLAMMKRFEEPNREHDFLYHNISKHQTVYYHQPYGKENLHVVPKIA